MALPAQPYWGAQFSRNDTARPMVPAPTNPGGAWIARANGMYTPENRAAMEWHLHMILDGAISIAVIRATLPGLLQEFSVSMQERDQVVAVLSDLDRTRYLNENFIRFALDRLAEGKRIEPYHTADIEANLSRVQGGPDCGTFGRQTPMDFINASKNYFGIDMGGMYDKFDYTGRGEFAQRDPQAGASALVQNNVNPIGARKSYLNAQIPLAQTWMGANPPATPLGTYLNDSEPIQMNTKKGRVSIYKGQSTFAPNTEGFSSKKKKGKRSATKHESFLGESEYNLTPQARRERAERPTPQWNYPAHQPQVGRNNEIERARQIQWGVDIGSVSPFIDDCQTGDSATSRAAIRNAAEALLDGWGSYDPAESPFSPPDVRPRQDKPIGGCGFPDGDGPYTKARWDFAAHGRKGGTKERISRKNMIGMRAYDRDIDEDLADTQYDGIVRGHGGANPLNSATAQSTIVSGELGGNDGGVPAYQRTTKQHWAGMDRHAVLDMPGTQRNGRSNNRLDIEGPGRAVQAGHSQHLRAYNRNLVRYTHPYASGT